MITRYEGHNSKKLVKPADKRRAADYAKEHHQVSIARACGLVALQRSSYYYVAQIRSDEALRAALKEAAGKHRRWGYRFLMAVLKREGFTDSHKRVYRIYREEGLQVKQRKRKRTAKRRGEKPLPPEWINGRWSMDFVHDATSRGQKIRMFTVLDYCTRRCLRIEVDTYLSGERVARTLDQLIEVHGRPETLLMDNGQEFTSRKLDQWAYQNQIPLQFIKPGKPTENGYVESFNGTLRNECLNEHWFKDLAEARQIIVDWRKSYNEIRPHSALKYMTPKEYTDYLNEAIPPRVDRKKENIKQINSQILTL